MVQEEAKGKAALGYNSCDSRMLSPINKVFEDF